MDMASCGIFDSFGLSGFVSFLPRLPHGGFPPLAFLFGLLLFLVLGLRGRAQLPRSRRIGGNFNTFIVLVCMARHPWCRCTQASRRKAMSEAKPASALDPLHLASTDGQIQMFEKMLDLETLFEDVVRQQRRTCKALNRSVAIQRRIEKVLIVMAERLEASAKLAAGG